MRKGKIICIDIETTGLDAANDEILQISIINGRGKTLYNSYIRPEHKREWKMIKQPALELATALKEAMTALISDKEKRRRQYAALQVFQTKVITQQR